MSVLQLSLLVEVMQWVHSVASWDAMPFRELGWRMAPSLQGGRTVL
jgi:hypothetical protein